MQDAYNCMYKHPMSSNVIPVHNLMKPDGCQAKYCFNQSEYPVDRFKILTLTDSATLNSFHYMNALGNLVKDLYNPGCIAFMSRKQIRWQFCKIVISKIYTALVAFLLLEIIMILFSLFFSAFWPLNIVFHGLGIAWISP